jgi:hypothetical protein
MKQLKPNRADGADREPVYYAAFDEFNLSIRSDARLRSRRFILFSLDGRQSSATIDNLENNK